MKPVGEWTEADLHELVAAGVCEGLTLDFKSSSAFQGPKFRDSLSQDVVAFANAAGGVLVYGILETDKKATGVDIGAEPGVMTAERLEDTVAGNTEPRVEGVRAQAILLANGRFAYVLSVEPATARAPHQANDKRYYRRFEARNLMMADHEVRDLMRREAAPRPLITLAPNVQSRDGETLSGALECTITNEVSEPILYAHMSISIDQRLIHPDLAIPEFQRSRNQAFAMGRSFDIAVFSRNWAPPAKLPIYREATYSLANFLFTVPRADFYILGWEATCPGARRSESGVWLASNGQMVRV